jgi:hypothetical protein
MVLSHQPHLDESTFPVVREEMLRFFADDGYPPVEVSQADLVSVVMDARFQVRAISLYGVKLGPDETVRLEQALVTAINQAIGEVTTRNAERLTRALGQASG